MVELSFPFPLGQKSIEHQSLESRKGSKSSPHLRISAFSDITPLFQVSAHARAKIRPFSSTGTFRICEHSRSPFPTANMLWPDDVTDEQLALAAATCDDDLGEGNEIEFGKYGERVGFVRKS